MLRHEKGSVERPAPPKAPNRSPVADGELNLIASLREGVPESQGALNANRKQLLPFTQAVRLIVQQHGLIWQ